MMDRLLDKFPLRVQANRNYSVRLPRRRRLALSKPAKTTLFAGVMELMSEKRPKAVFPIDERSGNCRADDPS